MGQYYRVYLKRNEKEKIYDRTIDGEYTPAKIMEHSWFLNPFVNTICHELYKKPACIAWVGDYSEDINPTIHKKVWDEDTKVCKVKEAQVLLFDKYICNHTTKQYLDCGKYFDKSCEKDGLSCIHPLPLLTAIGNGLGGGDYCGINEKVVGIWALNNISIEKTIPKDYTEFAIIFKEE